MQRLTAILLSSLLVVTSAGCGTGSSNTSDAGSPDAASDVKEGTEQTENTVKDKGTEQIQQAELVIWQHEPPAQRVAAWDAVIKKFMDEYPNISVTQEVVLWEDQQAKMLSAIPNKTDPDMNVVSDMSWSAVQLAGGLTPVDDIVEAIDSEQGFYDSALKSFYAEDHYWAVPIDSIAYSLMYRPSMLEAAGYTSPPKTWSELLDYAEKLTVDKDGDGNPDVYGIGVTTSRGGLTTDTIAAFLATANGDIFDESGNLTMDSPEMVKTLEYYTQLSQYAPPAASGWSWGEIEMNWAAGNLAMIPYHAPNLATFFEAGDYDIATTKLVGPDGESTPSMGSQHHAICVTKSAVERGNYDAVKLFLEFLSRPEITWILNACQEPGFFVPTTEKASELMMSGYFEEELFPLKNFDFSEESKTRTIYENFIHTASESAAAGYALGNKHGAVNLGLADIYNSNILSDMIQKIALENMPVQEAAEWGQKEAKKMLEQ